jgi:hypothetical protein
LVDRNAVHQENTIPLSSGMQSSLDDYNVVVRYLALSSDPRSAYQEVSRWLKQQAGLGRWDDLAELMPKFNIPGLDYTPALSHQRMMRAIRPVGSDGASTAPLRVSLEDLYRTTQNY